MIVLFIKSQIMLNSQQLNQEDDSMSYGSTNSSSMDDWMRTQPLSILQLDPADRIVLKIAVYNETRLRQILNSATSKACNLCEENEAEVTMNDLAP
uniref:Uncharacterized protein n=1 Tax=Romanomermis culicivorax TaxID=13658 RepID=A0A915KCJ0_ROMCU